MSRVLPALFMAAAVAVEASQDSAPGRTSWPLSLRDGLPASLPGYAAAPRDPLPDTDENEMGIYTEVSRFFQRIESPTSVKQFRLVVQDYASKDVVEAIKKAVADAAKTPKVEAREVKVAGFPAYAVTDRSGANPTTLVTVVVSASRLVLAQGANVEREEALKLLGHVDFPRVVATK